MKRYCITQDEPSVFHYTGAEGLSGILRSQNLWATDANFTNDNSELKTADSYINELLKALTDPPNDELVKALSSNAWEPWRVSYNGPYLTSFCKAACDYEYNDGLLSQWRGYGKDGGYAIEFDESILRKMIAKLDAITHFTPVEYYRSDKDIPESMSKLYDTLKENYKEIMSIRERKRFTTEEVDLVYEKHINTYIAIATITKDPGFREEKEIRAAIITRIKDDNFPFHHFIRNGKLVPYIKLFPEIEDSSRIQPVMRLPIKRIIVGPHAEKDNRVTALKTLVKNVRVEPLGGVEIKIDVSAIPYNG